MAEVLNFLTETTPSYRVSGTHYPAWYGVWKKEQNKSYEDNQTIHPYCSSYGHAGNRL
jgi:hypothetical protein